MTRKELFIGFLLLTFVSGALFSCKAPKSVSASVTTVAPDTAEIKLSEDARKEFEYLFIEGLKQKTLENFEDAIKIFSRCLEIDSRSSATLFEIANIHVSKGDFQSSMFMLEKAVLINPDNQYYRLLLVKVYQQNKLYEKAAAEYEVLSKMNPDNPDYPFYQAALLTMAGKNDQALAMYNQLEQKMGLAEPIAVGKQQIFMQMGNKPAAYAEIERLIKAYPAVSKYYGLLADMYLADKNRDKALENYNEVLKISPDDGFVHLSIASFYLEGNDSVKAYEHIRLAFKASSLELETKAQMYMLLVQPGTTKISDQQQLELLHILIESHIDDERPRALMVDYLISKKQPEEARKQLKLVLDMKKDNYMYWERLLLIDNDLLDWQSMNQDSKKALEYFPDQPLIYILKSVGLLQLKKYDDLILHDVFGAIAYKSEGLFIAGGAGVTPFIAIFRYLKSKNEIGNNKLIFANKTKDDIILADEFKSLLGDKFINVLSDEDVKGYLHGYITGNILKANIADVYKNVYVCGPPPMMDAIGKFLSNLHVDEKSIVKEAF